MSNNSTSSTGESLEREAQTGVQAARQRQAVVNLDGPHWSVTDPVNGVPLSGSTSTTFAAFSRRRRPKAATASRFLTAISTRRSTSLPQAEFPPDSRAVAGKDMGRREARRHAVHRLLGLSRHRLLSKRCNPVSARRRGARFQPGHKFDFVPILEGAQGQGKSTFIRILGLDWFRELAGDISKPQGAVGMLSGAWILEIGELSAIQRSK